eukprot:207859_1
MKLSRTFSFLGFCASLAAANAQKGHLRGLAIHADEASPASSASPCPYPVDVCISGATCVTEGELCMRQEAESVVETCECALCGDGELRFVSLDPGPSTPVTSSKSSKQSKPTSWSKDSEPKKDGGSSKSGKSLRDPNAGPESTT